MRITKNSFSLSTRRILSVLCLSAMLSMWPAAARAQSGEPTQRDFVRVYVSVIAPKTVSDIFGRRIAKQFVAIQVTITNRNANFQYLLHDVSLDLRKIYVKPLPERAWCRGEGCRYELSSLELSLLRGVAEKGQAKDPRNRLLRYLRGIGTVAAGLIGVTNFGLSYAPSVAIFQGPFLSAYSESFPDYTINQLNRLNDSAYKSNTLIPKQQAKVVVAFIPQEIFLNQKQRELFWNNPTDLFDDIDFRLAEAIVDGNFITEVENLPPAVTGIQIDEVELKKFQDDKPVVKGQVIGRSLNASSINLLNQEPAGLSLSVQGTPSDNRINFTIKSDKPVPPNTILNFEISNDQGVQTISKPLLFMPDLPTLNGIDPAEGPKGADELIVTLTGTNFVPGKTRVITRAGSGVHVMSVNVKGATSLDAALKIDANAATGETELRVVNPAGQSEQSVILTITEPTNNNQ